LSRALQIYPEIVRKISVRGMFRASHVVNYMGLFEDLLGAFDEGGEQLLEAILADNPELQARVAVDEMKALIAEDEQAISDLQFEVIRCEQQIVLLADQIQDWTGKKGTAESSGSEDVVAGATRLIEGWTVLGRMAWNSRLSYEKEIEQLTAAVAEKRDTLKALEEQ
jgi:hypothetical protein